MITGNKGEWGEIYVFLKLLADGRLYAADKNLNKISDVYYPIISILRKVSNKTYIYKRNTNIKVINENTGNTIVEISVEDFKHKSIKLFNKIKVEKGAFGCPDIEDFLKNIRIESIKAPADKKEDITLVVHDLQTGLAPELSFSIKTMLGSPSTLLNASKATNFTFKLVNPVTTLKDSNGPRYGEDEDLKLKNMLMQKESEGYDLQFHNMANNTFESNLRMVDFLLPQILGEVLKIYYLNKGTTLTEIAELLQKNDPMDFKEDSDRFYSHKLKNFLLDVALGMKPATRWDGSYDAAGGYIIVKDDGDILCYHLLREGEFKDYLLENTKLETPSTSRYNFGTLYELDGELFIDLNLQIRFIK